MHSLEPELIELGKIGVLEDEVVARELAIERRVVFSLFEELRAALYIGVALIVTGVGILLKEHLDHIGPVTLILGLAVAAGACYIPALRAHSRGEKRSTGSDYLLVLGALLSSADLGYAESQFHWLGADWSRHLLILGLAHAYTAYALNSRLVLSVALTALAAWFGIERGPGNVAPWHSSPVLGTRAVLFAGGLLLWRAIDQRLNAARFQDVFAHFAANMAFWGVVSWCADSKLQFRGLLALFVVAAVAIRKALKSREEIFAVYGVMYTAAGVSLVIAQLTNLALLGATLVLATVLAAATAMRYLHDLMKHVRS